MVDQQSEPTGASPLDSLTMESITRNQQVYIDLVARYYGDPDFKAEVDADPGVILRREGLEIPEGVTVKLLFNTDTLLHIVLPLLPDVAADAAGD